MNNFHTSVGEHVTNRFLQGSMDDAEMVRPLWEVFESIREVFHRGRKLDGKAFEKACGDLIGAVADSKPYLSHEHRRAATRTKPNGEAFELLAVSHVVRKRGNVRAAFVSRRMLLTRKRFTLDFVSTGLDMHPHLLERAVDRGIVSGDLSDIGHGILANVGLGLVWHIAYGMEMVPNDQIALPHAGGLLLGNLALLENASTIRNVVHRDGVACIDLPPNPYATLDAQEHGRFLRNIRVATAISESMMGSSQFYLHAALVAYAHRYRRALDEIARCILWPTAELVPNPDHATIEPALEQMARDLAVIVNDEDIKPALRGPKGRQEGIALSLQNEIERLQVASED